MPHGRRLRFPVLTGTAISPQLTALGAVDERMEPGQDTGWRTLEWGVLMFTRSGSADWDLDGKTLHHRPGTLFACLPGIRHRQRSGRGWWHSGYLVLQGPWLASLRGLPAVGGALLLNADRSLREAFDSVLDQVLEARDGWDWPVAASLAALLGRIDAASLADDAQLALDERLARIIDRDPAVAWTVPALAARLALSPSSLAHRCATELGCPPAAWVRARRVAHARTLLGAGLSVTATSERLGFANPYHFARVVRSVLGTSPSQLAGRGDGVLGRRTRVSPAALPAD